MITSVLLALAFIVTMWLIIIWMARVSRRYLLLRSEGK